MIPITQFQENRVRKLDEIQDASNEEMEEKIDSMRSTVSKKKTSKRRRLSSFPQDERNNYLQKVVRTLNVDDGAELRTVLSEICASNCIFIERYFEVFPHFPTYREMHGAEQIANYFIQLFHSIPDAMVTYLGSRLYERTDNSSYMIGKLKFSGIAVFRLQVSNVSHTSHRFLNGVNPFNVMYDKSSVLKLEEEQHQHVQHQQQQQGTVENSDGRKDSNNNHCTVNEKEIQKIEDKVEEEEDFEEVELIENELIEQQYLTDSQQMQFCAPLPTLLSSSSAVANSPALLTNNSNSVIGSINNTNINTNVTKPLNMRYVRKKQLAQTPLQINPENIIVSTPTSQYFIGPRLTQPFRIQVDITVVLHIGKDWKIWKCECHNQLHVKYRPT
jgi:hypothetical protein